MGPLPGQNLDELNARLRAARPADLAPTRREVMAEKGADGERRVAAVLARELEGSGVVLLYSQRVARPVGDIDVIAVGPGGVTIIDAKNWSGEVTVDRDLILRQNGRVHAEAVSGMLKQRRAVRLALIHARPELRNVRVREVLCLAQEELRIEESLTGGVVLAGAVGAARIAVREGPLSPKDITDLRATLWERLPLLTTSELSNYTGRRGLPPAPRRPTPATTELPRRPAPARVGALSPFSRASNVRSRRPASQRRRRPPATVTVSSLAVAVLLLIIALELRHYASTTPARPTLLVARKAGRTLVWVTAPAGDRVALRTSAGITSHLAYMRTTGVPKRWVMPRAWSRAPWLTVSACVVNRTDQCAGPTASGSDQSTRPGRFRAARPSPR